MSLETTATAPAKINLALAVGPVREDGFHALATVYQALSLEDTVTVSPSSRGSLKLVGRGVDVSEVPEDASNLAWRAAGALGITAAIRIEKRIPVAGGLAGGSADAAAVLVACNSLAQRHRQVPLGVMLSMAGELGSDVPFALIGGTAFGEGRGQIVTSVPSGTFWWVVLPAVGGLSTPAVFQAYDALVPAPPEPAVAPALLEAVAAGDATRLAPLLINDLQQAALSLRPELADVIAAGEKAGALRGIVSGSGPTTVFLCADEASASAVAAELGGVVAHSVDHGARVVA